jgi:hypothetical protein
MNERILEKKYVHLNVDLEKKHMHLKVELEKNTFEHFHSMIIIN